MILTLGFQEIACTKPIIKNLDLSKVNVYDSYLFVDAKGASREQWERVSPFSPTFEFQGILPTEKQCEEIYQYMHKGGIIFSSLVDPNKPIRTAAYCNELPLEKRKGMKIRGDECTIEFEYLPYNWLLPELQHLPNEAYDIHLEKEQQYLNPETTNDRIVESVIYNIGKSEGKLIFTSLLNKQDTFHCGDDFKKILKIVLREGKDYVASR